MPNLNSEIKALSPIDNKSKVNEVFAILKRRRTIITPFINEMICNHIKGKNLLEYYKDNVANVVNKNNSNPITSKKTTNTTVKTYSKRENVFRKNPSYYLLGDNYSYSEEKAKSKGSSKIVLNWAKVLEFVSDAPAKDKITKEQRAAAESWKPQPKIVERKEEKEKTKTIEDPQQPSISQSATSIKARKKEGLVDIVEALDACAKVRRKLDVFSVARVHCLFDENYETFWFTNRAYLPRELSGLRSFGRFVPKYSDIAIKMQRSKVGTSIDYNTINRIKRVEEHHIILENQSDLQNHTIAIAGDALMYQYRNIQNFLIDLRKNSEDIRDIESQIIALNDEKKNNPQKRSQINNSLKKLEEEYRILTLQQEDLKNITIYIRKQGEMRYSQIVDPIQTRIMSDNLFDGKTIVIIGGPGTGKTTTMIHRLAYLTNTFAIKEDSQKKQNKYKLTSAHRKQLFEAIKENRDWMFFSPSQMLKEYLADAMKKEGLTNTAEKVWNWKDYCRMLLQQNYHLLETDNSNAPFKLCYLKDTLFYQGCDIIDTFTNFYLGQFREIKDQLPKLETGEKVFEWIAIANSIKNRLEEAENYDLAHFISLFHSLESLYGRDRTRLLRERNIVLVGLAEKVCAILDENEKVKSEIKDIFDLTSDGLFEDAVEEDDFDDEDELENNSGLKSKLKKWFKPNSGNKPMEDELSSEIQKWLKSYCYSKVNEESKLTDENTLIAEILVPLIENKFDDEIQKIGELMVFEQYAKYTRGVCSIMLNGIPARYKKFRGHLIKSKYEGCDLKMLRDLMQNKQGKELHHQEQALLLGFINTLVKKIKDTAPTNFKNDYIDAYDEVARPIIGIDEATDFSICDIYAMQSLLTRGFNSLTLCGDIMQRMTNFGIKTWSELDNVVENPKRVEMKTSYRQSKKLLEVARQLYSDTLGEIPNYRAFMKSNKVPAPLVYVEENELYKIEWISKRISEVYRAYGEQFPSIAIFVTDKGYIPRFIEYLENTPFFKEKKIKAIDGTNASNIPDNHICVYSIDVVKGMEFDVVFFHNIDKSDANMEIVKRYIYVGVSRAAFFLGITMIEENREISRYFEKNKDWFNI